jgi:hypothetical protein
LKKACQTGLFPGRVNVTLGNIAFIDLRFCAKRIQKNGEASSGLNLIPWDLNLLARLFPVYA